MTTRKTYMAEFKREAVRLSQQPSVFNFQFGNPSMWVTTSNQGTLLKNLLRRTGLRVYFYC